MLAPHRLQHGFTLIEMTIVLVIIGLIVGGVLVGQSLIVAAGVRATITQVEKFNTAANTFREKYGYLPGDINPSAAAQFGLVARAGTRGRGDGNGLVEGYNYQYNCFTPTVQGGETLLFWSDLSQAGTIDGSFTSVTDAGVSGTNFSAYMPAAKLGGGNFIYVYSGGAIYCAPYATPCYVNGLNYFAISVPSSIVANDGILSSTPGLTVSQAYAIDQKIDDGLPTTGRITTYYVNSWNASNDGVVYSTGAIVPSPTTCMDQRSNAANLWQYSIEVNNGAGVNCALSFQFQAGD